MEIAATLPILAQVSWGWIAFLLVLGVLFAVAEIFVPSGGLLTVLSILCFVGGIVAGFFVSTTTGIVTLLVTVLLTPVLLYVLMRVWPHTPIAKRAILSGPAGTGKAGDLTHRQPGELEGRAGIAKTMLRPAGKMTLDDGRTIDCVTEGEYVQPGTRVRILANHGARVVIRSVPDQEEDETNAASQGGKPQQQ
ncbi:MAG: NfeD family protein [Planctomycetota bacterium]|nr:NfeD family protein [Planctomycetota bacterium]